MSGNFADAETELNESSSNDYDNGRTFEDVTAVKPVPRAVIEGDEIVDLTSFAWPDDRENIVKTNGRPDAIRVILGNPRVLDGDVYRSTETGKLFVGNEDSPVWSTEENYGPDGATGTYDLSYYNQNIEVEPVEDDELPEEIALNFNSWTGIRAARLLDVNGAEEATTTDGYNVTGLVERAGDGVEEEDSNGNLINPPRLARQLQLREDLEGPITFFWRNKDTGGQYPTKKLDIFDGDVFDDDGNLTTPIQFAENPEAVDTDATYSSLRWSHSGENGGKENPDADTSDVDMEDNPFADAESDTGNESTADDDVEWDDLTDEQQAFVESAVTYLHREEMGVDDVDFDAIYQRNVDDEDKPLTGDIPADTYREMVDDRLID